MTRRRFDVLIFDWDGTLLDSVDWIVECLQRAAGEADITKPSPEAARSVIGLSLSEALQALFPDAAEDRLSALIHAYRRHYFSKEISPDDLFEGVEETLMDLRNRGFQLAIATGKARAGLDRALRATRLSPLFSATRCADETASKPHPAMLNEIVETLRARRERVVMIGDSIHDLKMAENAGIAGIGVACGAYSREQLAAQNPLACLPHVCELPAFLF